MDSQDLSSQQVDKNALAVLQRNMRTIMSQSSQAFRDDNAPTVQIVLDKLMEWTDEIVGGQNDTFETSLTASLQAIVMSSSNADGDPEARIALLRVEVEKTKACIPDIDVVSDKLVLDADQIKEHRLGKMRLTNLVGSLLTGLHFVVKTNASGIEQPLANKQPDAWSAEAANSVLVVLDAMNASPPKVTFKSGNATAAWKMCSSAYYNGVAMWQIQFTIRFIDKYAVQFAASKLFLDQSSFDKNPLVDATAKLDDLGDLFKDGIANIARATSKSGCSYYEGHPGGAWVPRSVSDGSGNRYELEHGFTAMIAPVFWKAYEPFIALARGKDKALSMEAPDYNVKNLVAQKAKFTETRLEPIFLSLNILL